MDNVNSQSVEEIVTEAARRAFLYEQLTEQTLIRGVATVRAIVENALKQDVAVDVWEWDGTDDRIARECSSYEEYKVRKAAAGEDVESEKTYEIRHRIRDRDSILLAVTLPESYKKRTMFVQIGPGA